MPLSLAALCLLNYLCSICSRPCLSVDLEWKVVYVGSAENSEHDQKLEEVNVGPIPVGMHRFVLQAPAPNHQLVKNEDLIGVTVVLVTCSYLEQPFVQIGYYVNNEYDEPFEPENYPSPVDIRKLRRNILAEQPRVTRYAIDWTGKECATTACPVPDNIELANEPEEEAMEMGEEMEDEDEDSEEDDEGDENDEIDLGEEDDEPEGEGEGEGEGSGEGSGEGEAEAEGSSSAVEMEEDYGRYEGMEMLEDSNSIDIGRMIEKY